MSGRLADRAGTWLIAASAGLCVAVLLALLGWLACAGLAPFWPLPVEQLQLRDGRVLLGEVVAADTDAIAVRTSEVDRPGQADQRVRRADIVARSRPADAVTRTFADGRTGRHDARDVAGRGDHHGLLPMPRGCPRPV